LCGHPFQLIVKLGRALRKGEYRVKVYLLQINKEEVSIFCHLLYSVQATEEFSFVLICIRSKHTVTNLLLSREKNLPERLTSISLWLDTPTDITLCYFLCILALGISSKLSDYCLTFQVTKFLVEAILANGMTVLDSKKVILKEIKRECNMDAQLDR